jgi:hypothetical protein
MTEGCGFRSTEGDVEENAGLEEPAVWNVRMIPSETRFTGESRQVGAAELNRPR